MAICHHFQADPAGAAVLRSEVLVYDAALFGEEDDLDDLDED